MAKLIIIITVQNSRIDQKCKYGTYTFFLFNLKPLTCHQSCILTGNFKYCLYNVSQQAQCSEKIMPLVII